MGQGPLPQTHPRRLGEHPLAAAALQFPLAHNIVASVIPGLDSPQRVEQTIALYRHKIPAALWQDLRAENLIRADAPIP